MARILAVGIATVDIINLVEEYPAEDQEVRATAQQVRRGGNATNTLVVLSQLGHRCSWAGTLADEPDAAIIRADLARHVIDTAPVQQLAAGKVPTSYIALSRRNGSRTIVHYRDLPEYAYDHFARLDLSAYDWVHFEGRNVAETRRMLERIKAECPDLRCSVEIEKPRPAIETLFTGPDLLLFSRAYAEACGHGQATNLFQEVRPAAPQAQLVCAWGAQGACGESVEEVPCHSPPFPPPQVVDTLGAGDVFNAGVIDALLRGAALEQALEAGARLAGRKCGQYGLDGLVE